MLFHLICISSVTEYACPVYHYSLPQYLSFDLEGCQIRALRMIYPDCSYDEALSMTGLVPLHKRPELLSEREEISATKVQYCVLYQNILIGYHYFENCYLDILLIFW